MIKCKVYIDNEYELLDENVSVDIVLPGIPPINSILYLKAGLNSLADKARASVSTAEIYFPFGTEITPKRLKYLDFCGFNYVHDLVFFDDSDILHIVLSNKMNKFGS